MESKTVFQAEEIRAEEIGSEIKKNIKMLRDQQKYQSYQSLYLNAWDELFQILYDSFCRMQAARFGGSDTIEGVSNWQDLDKAELPEQFLEGLQFLKQWFDNETNRVDQDRFFSAIRMIGKKNGYAFLQQILSTASNSTRNSIEKNAKWLLKKWYRFHYPTYSEIGWGKNREVHNSEDIEDFMTPLGENALDSVFSEATNVVPKHGTILHLAVAFCVPPADLDRLLRDHGYYPLHIRNLFDLAIHSVLTERQLNLESEQDPFEELGEKYEKLLESAYGKLVASGSETLLEMLADTSFRNETAWIEEHTWKRGMSTEQILAFVSKYREAFQRMHQRLLNEHQRLWEEHQRFYSDALKDAHLSDSNNLYSFFSQYCKEITADTFQRKISSIRKDRHPTREWMLFLWIWDYSQKWHLWNDSVPEEFSGPELIAYLNNKLTAFDWKKLNENYVFDRVVLDLFTPLTIKFDSDGNTKATYQGRPLDIKHFDYHSFFSVPFQIIIQFLDKSGPMPLACDCCELL